MSKQATAKAAQAVLDFWFTSLDAKQRFMRDDHVDATIHERFGSIHAELSSSVPAEWQSKPHNLLAAIIVLDQFSRNLFRDSALAYAQDGAALALTEKALLNGWDNDLDPDEKQFLFMPLMHSEILANVERCRELMQAAGHQAGEDFAIRHADVIRRFGRYPARNAALGRASTADEVEFLITQPAGF